MEVDAGEEVSLLPAFPRPPHRLHVLLIYSPKAYKEGCEGLGEPQRGAIWRKGVFFGSILNKNPVRAVDAYA